MKNLIIALSLLFAVGASAQAKKAAPKTKPATAAAVSAAPVSDEAKVKKNVADLNAVVPLSDDQKVMMTGLFTRKYQMFKEDGTAPDKKANIARIIERKLDASFDSHTMETIKANKALFASLVGE
jgi:hypothetical protein